MTRDIEIDGSVLFSVDREMWFDITEPPQIFINTMDKWDKLFAKVKKKAKKDSPEQDIITVQSETIVFTGNIRTTVASSNLLPGEWKIALMQTVTAMDRRASYKSDNDEYLLYETLFSLPVRDGESVDGVTTESISGGAGSNLRETNFDNPKFDFPLQIADATLISVKQNVTLASWFTLIQTHDQNRALILGRIIWDVVFSSGAFTPKEIEDLKAKKQLSPTNMIQITTVNQKQADWVPPNWHIQTNGLQYPDFSLDTPEGDDLSIVTLTRNGTEIGKWGKNDSGDLLTWHDKTISPGRPWLRTWNKAQVATPAFGRLTKPRLSLPRLAMSTQRNRKP